MISVILSRKEENVLKKYDTVDELYRIIIRVLHELGYDVDRKNNKLNVSDIYDIIINEHYFPFFFNNNSS